MEALEYYHHKILNHPLFRGLKREEKQGLRAYYSTQLLRRGERLNYSGDLRDSLYILLEGKVIQIKEGSIGNIYLPGDFWNLDTLYNPHSQEGEDIATRESLVFRIKREGLRLFLQDYPNAYRGLKTRTGKGGYYRMGFPARPWKLGEINQEEGHFYYFQKRESWKKLGLRLLSPLFFFLLGLSLSPLSVGYLFFSLAGLAWGGLDFFFHSMVSYRVSEKSLHKETFSLRYLSKQIQDLSVDQITGVRVEFKGLLAKVLDVGDLCIQSRGGELLFKGIDHPGVLQKTVMALRGWQEQHEAQQAREFFQEILKESLQGNSPGNYKGEHHKPVETTPSQEQVFHKSRVVLAATLALPSFLFLGGVALPFLLPLPGAVNFLLWTLGAIMGAKVLWLFLDWWNDVYRVAGAYVWEVQRNPFGTEEVRKQIGIPELVNVQVYQKGPFQLFMDYGDVVIKTPGGDELLFRKVGHPRTVQEKLFTLRDGFLERERQKRRVENLNNFKEYTEVLNRVQQPEEEIWSRKKEG